MPRVAFAWLGAWTLALLATGCAPREDAGPAAHLEVAFDPSPPAVGDVQVSLRISHPDGAPLEGAQVRLEGNMNHAGMRPSWADMREVEPGRYEGTLAFTMRGDWFVLVHATTADGDTFQRQIDVPGVQGR